MMSILPADLPFAIAQVPAAAGPVFFWCAVVLAAAASLGVIAWWLRRRMISGDDSEPLPMGFSLSDLRTLHAQGELTDEEFEHAKRKMVAGTRARLAVEPAAAAGTETNPASPRTDPSAGEDDGIIRWDDPAE